jgi:DNA primase
MPSAPKKCSKCRCVWYCDRKCQKAHWKYHEGFCDLAEKAGVELPKERISSAPQISKDEKTRLRECLESAMKFYQSKLKTVPLKSGSR